ncbi:hypothetical protein SARC_13405 [Sphaeroforma arctica JP610]|uniref:Uncharacterized protein n=1 Tax=Sphaeroforma arctica JP610 TaxID=667725 RepID=A0A0L0FC28_9EUKA|nr:hypothetical protein SARC_13405 [Sphaeroforma arctica JP610]KNC74036.1 hypothetical protein SARC_13405 [Sphaeroforma arctica JP610]|eukprot:XP_014147938.1 hypothetical protein SARC_13405 [Sphaeroforma arctica JP610]
MDGAQRNQGGTPGDLIRRSASMGSEGASTSITEGQVDNYSKMIITELSQLEGEGVIRRCQKPETYLIHSAFMILQRSTTVPRRKRSGRKV